jgi:hypothetical protein
VHCRINLASSKRRASQFEISRCKDTLCRTERVTPPESHIPEYSWPHPPRTTDRFNLVPDPQQRFAGSSWRASIFARATR